MKRIDALLVVSLFWHYTNDGGKVQLATLYKSINVLQNPCWDILKKCAVSAMIEVQKKENHRRAATPSQNNGITAYRVKVGRLFLFFGNDVASDENND